MKIIYNNIIPFKGFAAINLFGLLLVRQGCAVSDTMIRHESIHTKQMQELLYIGFYVAYFFEWVFRLAQHKDNHEAYHAVSFEREAYDHDKDPDYLANRPHFEMWK